MSDNNGNALNTIFPDTSKRRRRTLNPNDPIVKQLFAGVKRRTSLRAGLRSTQLGGEEVLVEEEDKQSRGQTNPTLVTNNPPRPSYQLRTPKTGKPEPSANLSHRFRAVQRPNTRRPRPAKKPASTLSPHTILSNLLSALPTTTLDEPEPEDIPVMVRDNGPRLSTISDKLNQVVTEFNNSPLPNVENYFDVSKHSSGSNTSRRLSGFYDTTGELIVNHHSKRLSDVNNISLFSSSRDSLKMELDEAFNQYKQHTPESIGRISDVNVSVSDSSNILTGIVSPQSEPTETIPNPDFNDISPNEFPEPFPDVDYTLETILPDIGDLNKTASSIGSNENTAAPINPNEPDQLQQPELDVIPETHHQLQHPELDAIPETRLQLQQPELDVIPESHFQLQHPELDANSETHHQLPVSNETNEREDPIIIKEDIYITRPDAPDAPDLPDMTMGSILDPDQMVYSAVNSDRGSPSSSLLTTPTKYSPLSNQLEDDIYNGFDPFSLEEDPFLAQSAPPVKLNKFISDQPARATSLLKLGRAGFGVKAGVPRVSRGLRQRVKKTYKTKVGEDVQNLPDSLVSELANMSLNPGLKGPRLSSDCLDILHKATFLFFQQTSQSLSDYARHAGRRTIEYSDTELLFRRQKLINDRNSMLTLLSQHLPQELVQLVEDRANPNPVKLSR